MSPVFENELPRSKLRGIYCHSGLDPESNLQMDSRFRGNDACEASFGKLNPQRLNLSGVSSDKRTV